MATLFARFVVRLSFLSVLLVSMVCAKSQEFGPEMSTATAVQTNVTFFQSGNSLTINCNAPNSSIWYTTANRAATPVDTPYTSSFTVSSGQQIHAICAYTGYSSLGSQTSTAAWKCNAPGAPITSNGWTCNSSGGVTGSLTSFNFTAGSTAIETASTATTTNDASILYIHTPTATCDACITATMHVVYRDTTNAGAPGSGIENSETDFQSCCDPITKAFWQASVQCQGSSGKLEINASGSWQQLNIPCTIGAPMDLIASVHWIQDDTSGANGVGQMYFDYIIENGTVYSPLSQYGLAAYPLVAQPTWTHFTAGDQLQLDIWNVNHSAVNPTTVTRSISTNDVTVTKGIVGVGTYTAS